jgi:hypothetical protein
VEAESACPVTRVNLHWAPWPAENFSGCGKELCATRLGCAQFFVNFLYFVADAGMVSAKGPGALNGDVESFNDLIKFHRSLCHGTKLSSAHDTTYQRTVRCRNADSDDGVWPTAIALCAILFRVRNAGQPPENYLTNRAGRFS